MMTRRSHFGFVLFLAFYLLSQTAFTTAELLPMCTNNFTKTTNLQLTDEWYHWGRFYSYCFQVNNAIDTSCNSTACKACIQPCYMNLNETESVATCNSACINKYSNTDEQNFCKQGCGFYLFLLQKPDAPSITLDNSKLPINVATVSRVDETFTETGYEWTSADTSNIPSVYLITLDFKDSFNREASSVLGLTKDLDYLLNDGTICSNKGIIFNYDTDMKLQLNILPMNSNGIKANTSSSLIAMKKLSSPADFEFSKPLYDQPTTSNIPHIEYTIAWKNPTDVLFYELVKETRVNYRNTRQCEIATNTNIMLTRITIADADVNVNTTSYTFRIKNTDADNLKSCPIDVQIIPLIGSCLVGQHGSPTVVYPGCQNVTNYPAGRCDPPTTPKPTDDPTTNYQLEESNWRCLKTETEVCFRNKTVNECGECFSYENINRTHFYCTECEEAIVDLKLTWDPPKRTATPLEKYILVFGPQHPFFKTAVNGPRIDIPKNQTFHYIYNYTGSGTVGFTVFPQTSTPGVQFMQLSANYSFFDVELDTVVPPPVTTTTPKPTTTTTVAPLPVSGEDDSGSDGSVVAVAIIIPLICIVVLVVLFVFWRRRRFAKKKGGNSPWSNDDYYWQNKNIVTDEWEIFPENIILDEKIGEGAFGTVFSANIEAKVLMKTKYSQLQGGGGLLLSDKNGRVAVKLLKEGAGTDEMEDFREEIHLMKSIGYHKNIVNLIGCSTIQKPLCLIVEFLPYGDLLHYLRKRRSKLIATTGDGEKSNAQGFMYTKDYQDSLLQTSVTTVNSQSNLVPDISVGPEVREDEVLTADDLISFAWQIASGMEYLAANKMVHRDLAARNILVGDDKMVKISDFGLTRRMSTDMIYMSRKSRKLPVKWMSVEAIFMERFTSASDVWAYGIVLFEIVTLGGTPYPSVGNRELLKLLKSGYRMEKPENCAEAMYDIMLHCWNEDPDQRPNFTELRDHLEDIISEGDKYLSFDINADNTYYNVASFKSAQSDEEDDELFDEVMKNRNEMQENMKTDEEKKQEEEENAEEDRKLEEKVKKLESDDTFNGNIDRYISPKSLKDSDGKNLVKGKEKSNGKMNEYIDSPGLVNRKNEMDDVSTYVNKNDSNFTAVL